MADLQPFFAKFSHFSQAYREVRNEKIGEKADFFQLKNRNKNSLKKPMNLDPKTKRYMLFERALDDSRTLMQLYWISDKVEHAKELLCSYCFYTNEDRKVRENAGYVAAILGDVIDLLNDAARTKIGRPIATQSNTSSATTNFPERKTS